MSRILLACLVAALLALALPARATAYTVRFCPEVDTDYEDSDADDGDFWDNDDNRPARGFLVRVANVTNPPPWPIVYEDYVSESGESVGCTPELTVFSNKQYRVRVWSEAKIGGSNYIYSADDATNQEEADTIVLDGWSPTADGDVVGTPLDGATEPRWNHLAAAAFSLYRSDAGLDNQDFYLDTTLCTVGGVDYPCANETFTHVGDSKWKFLVAHEFGHTVSMKRDAGGTGCANDPTALEDGCHGDTSTTLGAAHGTLTKEYQSAAGCEGVADFYSALVWNTSGASADCQFSLWYRLDWNDDYLNVVVGSLDTLVGDPYNCIGDPFAGSPDPVGQWDWLEDLVNADDDDTDLIQCTSPLTNRGTSYDWHRYFWAMRTIEGVSEADLWQLWDDADPHNWRASDAGTADYPIDRMADAAATSFATQHGDQDDHGLDH